MVPAEVGGRTCAPTRQAVHRGRDEGTGAPPDGSPPAAPLGPRVRQPAFVRRKPHSGPRGHAGKSVLAAKLQRRLLRVPGAPDRGLHPRPGRRTGPGPSGPGRSRAPPSGQRAERVAKEMRGEGVPFLVSPGKPACNFLRRLPPPSPSPPPPTPAVPKPSQSATRWGSKGASDPFPASPLVPEAVTAGPGRTVRGGRRE